MIKICFGVGRVQSLVREVPYASRCGQNKQIQFCGFCNWFVFFFFLVLVAAHKGLPRLVLVVKHPPANAGDVREEGLVPVSGRSSAGGHSNPLQYSCWENPMDRDWQATVHVGHRDSDKAEATEHAAHIFPTSCRISPCGTWTL